MENNQLIKIFYIVVIIILTSCNGISKKEKENSSVAEYSINKNSIENIDVKISDQTTSVMSQLI